ncbi:MAG: CDGSH iron-sulfur domain-containing protein [Anaerolineaceae bacterium]|nr:CDGSH iron-sulfur domain-containing protein [Anaerolineaceae bacterium]
MLEQPGSENNAPKIVVRPDGALRVYGNVPLVHKTQVVSEFGEPLTWKKEKTYQFAKKQARAFYSLCRCGHSKNMPYCDGEHRAAGFDGTETADTRSFAERQSVDESGEGLVVKYDGELCMLSGFCKTRMTNIEELMKATAEPRVRAEIIAMIERCPSGTYAYAISKDEADIEADLPVQIAVTTEITADGPIQGPLWVTGNIEIERADGEPFETRNRVTLCNCGQSSKKPLCDGSHRAIQQEELRKQKKMGE